MYRLAYRNFPTGVLNGNANDMLPHESLVVNHSVAVSTGGRGRKSSITAVRWYELRNPNGTPTVYQQGTFSPDTNHRWMGSIAMDKIGDLAVGYSISSTSIFPSIRYTGRGPTDALGTMQGENIILAGSGSQLPNLSRWGDYSSITVDPSDDCTFWYTNQYIPSNGSFNWKTRIGSFKFPSCGTGTNDFSISANPTSLPIAQGSSGTSTISTAVTSGVAGTVNLSAAVSPSGPTASLNPTSVTAGNSSTLTVTVGSSVPTGNYTVTVTGVEGSVSHSTSVTVTVTASGGGGITNGGFETGSFSGWSTTGTTSISTTAHTGTYSGQAGGSSPTNGDSTISQTFTVPGGSGTLSFWYQVHCPDTLQFDWATATLKDNTSNTTTTILAKTCNNNATWVKVSASVTAGHSYTLTLVSHDDNFAGDPTFTLFDDVALSAGVTNPVTNPGFETGNFSGWSTTGTTSISTTAHSGSFSGQAGSTSPTNGDSTISQTFTIPSGGSTLSFWYQVHCPDTLQFDWATATLKDNTSNTTTTILARTCNNNATWVQVTAGVTAGHSYTLTLISHVDNFAGDPTFTLFDDVNVS